MENSLNQTPMANRLHIGFFGLRNAGKSSVVNAITNQEISIVSDVLGTTTDPTFKAMELLPLGPIVIIDTPGLDDTGELGEKRVQKAKQILNKTDIAVLVIDSTKGVSPIEKELISLLTQKNIRYIIAYNKCDLKETENLQENEIMISATSKIGIEQLKQKLADFSKTLKPESDILGKVIAKNDLIVLVTPIDSSAPKGRLILPQVQTLRDILDNDAVSLVTKTSTLKLALSSLKNPPKLVITDSKDFKAVSEIVPKDVLLTSFSIVFARYKGILKTAVNGATGIDNLQNGDSILICEGCTHHRQCEDIGTKLLPKLITNFTKKELNFEFTSGGFFPTDLAKYSLIVHCGGCMLNEREVLYRQKCAEDYKIPFTNYGILLAKLNGILERSIEVFKADL
ncbi:MAG: [FeFe] hydrogenase H-cluster maturation GTPase HydF [Clostridia bacterium]